MLKLRADYGGDAWAARFFRQLATVPEVAPVDAGAGLRQGLGWLVAASAAAGRDLSGLFVDRWRLPLSAETRRALAAIDWTAPGLAAGTVLAQIPVAFTRA